MNSRTFSINSKTFIEVQPDAAEMRTLELGLSCMGLVLRENNFPDNPATEKKLRENKKWNEQCFRVRNKWLNKNEWQAVSDVKRIIELLQVIISKLGYINLDIVWNPDIPGNVSDQEALNLANAKKAIDIVLEITRKKEPK